MKYPINLFGYQTDCNLSFKDGELQVRILEEDQQALKNYLVRALPRYGVDPTGNGTLEQLINYSVAVEKKMKGRMSEPRIKLPYEFQPEIKEKLIEAAEIQEISATRLLIRLIEKKYKEVMEQEVN